MICDWLADDVPVRSLHVNNGMSAAGRRITSAAFAITFVTGNLLERHHCLGFILPGAVGGPIAAHKTGTGPKSPFGDVVAASIAIGRQITLRHRKN